MDDTNQQENDSAYIKANAIDSLSGIPQQKLDSINHIFLDSLTKHMDTNNAEFGAHH